MFYFLLKNKNDPIKGKKAMKTKLLEGRGFGWISRKCLIKKWRHQNRFPLVTPSSLVTLHICIKNAQPAVWIWSDVLFPGFRHFHQLDTTLKMFSKLCVGRGQWNLYSMQLIFKADSKKLNLCVQIILQITDSFSHFQ